MEDKFDKIFSAKVKEVTENNEAPYNPEHWNLLLAKKKKNKRRVLFYWPVAAFLIIAVLGGLGKYFFSNSDLKQQINPKIILDSKNDSLRIDSLKNNDKIYISSSEFDSLNNSNTIISEIDTVNAYSKNKSTKNGYSKAKEVIVSNEIKTKDAIILKDKISKKINDSVNVDIHKIFNNLNNENKQITQIIDKELNNDSITNNNAIVITNQKLKKDSLNLKKDISLLEDNEVITEANSKKPIKLGVDLAPSYNYNQESESSNVGFVGGITVDIPISNKFDINTGILYADQTINLNKPASNLSDIVSSKSSSQIIEKQAIIKGIEIPFNLKYNFSIDKKDLFIAAGITSTTYIKDNIEEIYLVNNRAESSSLDAYGNNIVRYELIQTNNKVVTPNDSNNFNIANILNFSFGIELPVNMKQQSIIIEPYFKYSLMPVTKQNLDFSSVGVHLRYNFSLKNKN
ncbi:hypothetical protein BX611_1257 [Lutibacter oceani]|uniref:Outer membrane protein with beta-barrel domain n=1 Tax=Lutibacter oceani TaxID=1853311 RepID=A0A3D9RVE1_9FLAO|nr:hypothetical protein [Lutibacter oceani]REE81721.1 hypothetical protein BX611_1257 [Lutibacter oceani]